MNKLNEWLERRSRTSYYLMLIVGAYLFYADYKMYGGLAETAGSPLPIYVFMGLFALAGVVLLSVGAYALTGGRYSENRPDGAEGEEAKESSEEKDSE